MLVSGRKFIPKIVCLLNIRLVKFVPCFVTRRVDQLVLAQSGFFELIALSLLLLSELFLFLRIELVLLTRENPVFHLLLFLVDVLEAPLIVKI